MKILITGACGFVGNCLAEALLENFERLEIIGMDNLSRAGSETNRPNLKKLGITFLHSDIRSASDLEKIPPVDWVIDAAANPSVLAGKDGSTSSRQLIENNLYGTVNLLEYCKRHKTGFILLSTSRVYGLKELSSIPVLKNGTHFSVNPAPGLPHGLTPDGLSENFSTTPPLSLYGNTKLSSENLAIEYSETFDFPLWINRCGVLAGKGQFGRPDQGILSYWVHSWVQKRPLRYIGFEGKGLQTRDFLHPQDLVSALKKQMDQSSRGQKPIISNFSGGLNSARSLLEMSNWCENRFGSHDVTSDLSPRAFDTPWLVLDSEQAQKEWDWKPETSFEEIIGEIAQHAEKNPNWLDLSTA
jgi:CDP-paratose 2-epimerase